MGIQEYEKLKEPLWDELVLLDDSNPEKRRVETARGKRVHFSVWDDKQAFEENLRHLRNRFPYIKYSLLRRFRSRMIDQPVADDAQSVGGEKCAPVELFEKVLAHLRKSSGGAGLALEFWAREKGIGRAAFFQWKRGGGRPVKGKLSVQMVERINQAVAEEARSLGLLQTDRADAATATATPPSLPVACDNGDLCNADHIGESEQQPDFTRTQLGPRVETNSD